MYIFDLKSALGQRVRIDQSLAHDAGGFELLGSKLSPNPIRVTAFMKPLQN